MDLRCPTCGSPLKLGRRGSSLRCRQCGWRLSAREIIPTGHRCHKCGGGLILVFERGRWVSLRCVACGGESYMPIEYAAGYVRTGQLRGLVEDLHEGYVEDMRPVVVETSYRCETCGEQLIYVEFPHSAALICVECGTETSAPRWKIRHRGSEWRRVLEDMYAGLLEDA
ncbi:MAG: hypothetical protein ACK4SY_09680 [Pyrobaculum sp.]